ncbi:MAG: anti-sigma regulatory factor [Bacillota bacterium]|nr:MAG: anti-sigma regulatory factor [Bacillota bacterium]MBS3949516.1 ATP-binding protein [Peptococcaceae bacterium]
MVDNGVLDVAYPVVGGDFGQAGEGASKLKRVLQQIGLAPSMVRRIAVASYEAELNIVIHAFSGMLKAKITASKVEVWAEDQGPGIPNVELAMTEGYSTAPDHIRALGFGAGLGLPNIRRNADAMEITTALGTGTTVYMAFSNVVRKEQ